MNLLKNIYLTNLFFLLLAGNVALFVAAFLFDFLLFPAGLVLLALIVFTSLDAILLFVNKNPFTVERVIPSMLNLGDSNFVEITIQNNINQHLNLQFIESFPVQLQRRNRQFDFLLIAGGTKQLSYHFKPTQRGEYIFGDVWVFVASMMNLTRRRIIIPLEQTVNVYPSILQMKQFELRVFHQQSQTRGLKKIRRIGHNNEFEQIKNYIQGDDLRTVNWKATSKKSELMVNQYQEERSQSIYAVIDKSRNMQMDFENMTMLDYAINSALVFANIALKKGDKAGLITFSDKIGTQLSAERSSGHLRRILNALYKEKTHFNDANFELLYESLRQTVKTRSLLMLYTNFESEFAMRRALPTLKRINQRHVLVVVFFQNNGLEEMAFQKPNSIREIYAATIAEKLITVKINMARELRQNGIQTILTRPEDLSMQTINKYLELKAKGAL
jgi:uncharacterized protein (DUF58 family)